MLQKKTKKVKRWKNKTECPSKEVCNPFVYPASFILRCSGDLSKDLNNFRILDIEVYNGRKKQDQALYDSLVPVMYAKDYEDIAEQFLRDVCPKALVNNTPPDPLDIAGKLGPKVSFTG